MTHIVDSMQNPWVNLLTIRDGQQSTLAEPDMIFDTSKFAKILAAASTAGFRSAEVAGGQNFQSAIKRGYNPFNLLEYMDMITRDSDGKKTINLQMLFRGANALGFKHYPPIIIEKTLEEFRRLGINKFRIFDALNDIDNIYIPDSLKKPGVEIQGALSFGHYPSQPDRYTDEYYVNYAQKLVDKGCNSIAIKDMSGQLDGKRAKSLVSKLKKQFPDIPIELHIHSTNEDKSKQAVNSADEAGINGIETVEGPLSKGSAHHDYATFSPHAGQAYDEVVKACQETFGEVVSRRLDKQIPQDVKETLCAIGVPGGAMPFVMDDLKKYGEMIAINSSNHEFFMEGYNRNQEKMYKDSEWTLKKSIELFTKELPRVCKDANYPLLVTPTADICCKQAIFNLIHGSNLNSEKLEDRYNLSVLNKGFQKADIRFIKLILGHYGQMKEYSTNETTINDVSKDVKKFFSNRQNLIQTVEGHPYEKMLSDKDETEWNEAQKQAQALTDKYPIAARSFASLDQLTIMYALKPSGGLGDPIEKALEAYIARNKEDLSKRSVSFPIIDFHFLFEPLFKHLDNLAVLGKLPDDPFKMTLKEFGALGERMYDVYLQMPGVAELRDFVKNANLNKGEESFKIFKESSTLLIKNLKSLADFKNTSLYDLVLSLKKLEAVSRLVNKTNQSYKNFSEELQKSFKQIDYFLPEAVYKFRDSMNAKKPKN
jgi:pyruvate/oxaloacetate carboxyltransferase